MKIKKRWEAGKEENETEGDVHMCRVGYSAYM